MSGAKKVSSSVTVQVVGESAPAQYWEPTVGEETNSLLARIPVADADDRNQMLGEAVGILSRSIRPRRMDKSSTGLAIGYVQSGKTSSFTVVTALARDNDFALIIVIAGTSIPLFDQSDKRLVRDLQLDTRPDRAWMHIANPTITELQRVQGPLLDWREKESNRQVVLMTVMKNHNHLRNLNALLQSLDLEGVATLIIDDEADQASLNTRVRTQQESTTYRAILGMRRIVPHHTFLQYTATPQAPLLISLIDILSPSFARILTPGKGYTGGREFFSNHPETVRVIPNSQLPTPTNNLSEPPDSLLAALRLFYLGVAAAYVESHGVPQVGNRSMLIHPSQGVIPHALYEKWVREVQQLWVGILEADESDPDRTELIAEFTDAYVDLSRTEPSLPEFAKLAGYLAKAISRTVVTLMNSTPRTGTPQVRWNDTHSHILIGGQAMDRGFTVEGLTVTYMPRSVGVRNIDTIQQRARFFGYKAAYFGLCRVFLEAAAHDAYRNYLDHEESVRKELSEHGDRALSEWKRKFLLDSTYRPTRQNVLGLAYEQGEFSDKWFRPVAPHRDPEAVTWNRAVVDRFMASISDWREDDGHPQRTIAQRHLVARVDLQELYELLLAPLRMVDTTDSVRFTGLLLEIQSFLEQNAQEDGFVFHMSKGEFRERSINSDDEIINLYQGRNPLSGPIVYPGDDRIKVNDHLTVQIHNLRTRRDNEPGVQALAVTVWLPARMSVGWLVAR